MDNNESRKQKQETAERRKRESAYLLALLRKIAAAFRVDLSEATTAIYLEQLSQCPRVVLDAAIDRTICEWAEASKMPPLKFILDRVRDENSRPQLINDARRILDRYKVSDKPPDWEPMSAEQLEEFRADVQRVAKLRVIPGYKDRKERKPDGAA